jgi:hypothetical protein
VFVRELTSYNGGNRNIIGQIKQPEYGIVEIYLKMSQGHKHLQRNLGGTGHLLLALCLMKKTCTKYEIQKLKIFQTRNHPSVPNASLRSVKSKLKRLGGHLVSKSSKILADASTPLAIFMSVPMRNIPTQVNFLK